MLAMLPQVREQFDIVSKIGEGACVHIQACTQMDINTY